ncbi:MAG: O-antigen ligase family protein [Patescibacteria group bacterium]
MIIFYFLFSIFYFLVAIWQPKWALFLICVLLPTYQIRFQFLGLPTTLLEVMILILFIVWFFKFKIYRLSNIQHLSSRIQSWLWLILAWLVAGLVAVFVSPNKWAALGHWRAYFLEPILLLIVFLDISHREAKNLGGLTPQNFKRSDLRKNIILALSISAFGCSIWAILQKFLGGGAMSLETWRYPLTEVWRATGPFPQPNFLGLYLAPIIILAFGQLIENFKNKRILAISYWLLVIIAGLLAIILARSEGAILGILAGLIFSALIYRKSRKWVAIGLIILIIIGFSLPITRNYFIEKITFQDFSGQIRLKIWSETLTMLKDRPIFGAGLRGYQTVIEKYHQPYFSTERPIPLEIHPYPHNIFLAIWSELGILGLIVSLWILIKFFYQGFNKIIQTIRTYPNTPNKVFDISYPRRISAELIFLILNLSAMIALLVHGTFDTPYFKNDLAVLFWLIVGLMISNFYR